MTMFDRRDVLRAGLVASALAPVGRAWAAPQTDVRLLLVFLRGGYDAANVVIPTASPFYFDARPNLKIAKPNPADSNASLALDADWSLHPALRDTVYPLWLKKQASFICFAGSDDLTRSHFETQDTIELGQAVDARRDFRSGFLGRLCGQLAGTRPIAFTELPPLIFRGEGMIPNLALGNVGKAGIDPRQARLIQEMYRNESLSSAVAEGFKVQTEVYRSVAEEMVAANRGAISPKGFELSARRIGRLMRTNYNLAFVDVGGWDTHVNQGAATGALAGRLLELGRGLAGFVDEIGPKTWESTVVVVVSEFGRTFRENGDRGTDHGHGSAYWVLGGGVKGGRIVGEQTSLTPKTLNQGRDYPVLNDYRALLGGLMGRVFQLDAGRLAQVFPGVSPRDMGLL